MAKKKIKPLEKSLSIELHQQVFLRSPYGNHLIGPYIVLSLDPIILSRHYYSVGSRNNQFSQWMTFFTVEKRQLILTTDKTFIYKGAIGTTKDWFLTDYFRSCLKHCTLFPLITPEVCCVIED